MSGICGWLHPSGLVGDANATLAKMRNGLGAPEASTAADSKATSALTAYSPFNTASTHSENGLHAAIDGRTRWDTPELEQMSRAISPAAALITAYRRYGKDCLKHLHGSFSLALLEPTTGTALIAIDRMGIHRLCFAHQPEGLVFGSTTDSVTAHPAIGRSISQQGIFNYLFYHMIPAPGTVYDGIEKLLPAQYALLQNGRISHGFYWEASWEITESVDFTQRASEFKQLLRDAVGTISADQTRLGTFLSGGTDSSTVTGVLTEVGGQSVETFSIGFQAEGFDEIAYARLASRRFGTHAHEYYLTPNDVVRAVPLIAAAYDEPFGNASAVPTYFCALKAKEAGIDTLLAGDGGDEIFGGNVRYAKQRVFEAYGHLPHTLRSALIEPILLNLPGASKIPLLRKAQSYVRQARIPLPDRLESYNFLHTTPLEDIFTPTFLSSVDRNQPTTLLREPFFRTRSDATINRMLHLDWKQTLADNDLRKVCRMCEAAGVEARYPLLDQSIVDFAASLPLDYKVRGSYLRWFFKEALKDFLPAEIINKSKHGFGLPFGLWMETHQPLRDLAYDSLAAFRKRGFIEPAFLDRLITLHRTEHANYYGVLIWVIMMLEQWLHQHEASSL